MSCREILDPTGKIKDEFLPVGTFPPGNYVPYNGATQDVDLGTNNLTSNAVITSSIKQPVGDIAIALTTTGVSNNVDFRVNNQSICYTVNYGYTVPPNSQNQIIQPDTAWAVPSGVSIINYTLFVLRVEGNDGNPKTNDLVDQPGEVGATWNQVSRTITLLIGPVGSPTTTYYIASVYFNVINS
jgi:hypothetical protein